MNKAIYQFCDLCSRAVTFTFDFSLIDTPKDWKLVIHICKNCKKYFKPTKDWECI